MFEKHTNIMKDRSMLEYACVFCLWRRFDRGDVKFLDLLNCSCCLLLTNKFVLSFRTCAGGAALGNQWYRKVEHGAIQNRGARNGPLCRNATRIKGTPPSRHEKNPYRKKYTSNSKQKLAALLNQQSTICSGCREIKCNQRCNLKNASQRHAHTRVVYK